MTRRLWLAWVGLVVTASSAWAQIPFTKDMLPARTALARVGLERHWFNVIPLGGRGERVLEVSIDDNLVFAQTNQANFYTFDAESGRLLWTSNFGQYAVDAQPASVNSTMVFVTNANMLHALDRKTGREVWSRQLEALPASSTAADESRVWVGLISGSLKTYSVKDGKDLWNAQTLGELSSRPHPAGKVIAYASHDGKVYVSRADSFLPLFRWASGAEIIAPLGAHGERTLLVPSMDRNLYAVDLFTGTPRWNYPTDGPIAQEPLVARDDVYIVNTLGRLVSVNALTGEPEWSISTLGGPLLGVSKTRVYLESRDGDLFIVDRATGQMLFDPRATHERAGVNIREFELGPTNRLNDRIYLASKSGMLLCFRESGAILPYLLRDPKAKPFGYIPPEGYPDTPAIPKAITPPDATTPDAAAAPAEPK